MVKISAVICVKNGESSIERTLKSLIKNDVDEIIIVDGKSQDDTIKIAKRYTDKIFSDEGKGLGYARQLGAIKSNGEIVAYIDSDTELPEENLLIEMYKEMKEKNWSAIHAQLIDPFSNKTYWEKGENFHWQMKFNKPGERKSLGTIICLIDRNLILKYKFDRYFTGSSEDGEFYYRIVKAGNRIGVSKFIGYHYHRSTMKEFIKQRIWYGEGVAKIIKKHHIFFLIFSPIFILTSGILLSIKNFKIQFIPFYFIWSLSLLIGILKGIIHK